MYLLGINAYHADSSACLLKDGELLAAVEEERLCRVKHWSGFPGQSILYCLKAGGITLSDVEGIAVNRDRYANLFPKMTYALLKRPSLGMLGSRVQNVGVWRSFRQHLTDLSPDHPLRARFYSVEHHRAHMGSAFFVSPYEQAVVVSVDGFGDFASAAWGKGSGDQMSVDGRVLFPHSLGIFYEALTQFIGFPHYGDEYKVMGLAPNGEARYLPQMRQLVELKPDGTYRLNLRYFRHPTENIGYSWKDCAPSVGKLYTPLLQELLGAERTPEAPLEQRHRDIARSVQAMYEEAFFHLLNTLHRRYGLDSLALAGGCAMNSVANGTITTQTPFKQVYIQSAAGDAGGAIGAAYSAWHSLGKHPRHFVMNHAYWGPGYDNEGIAALLKDKRDELQKKICRVERIENSEALCQRTADVLSRGSVVGWFQGRLEWGPRALGNRSILCDPRRSDMKELLNSKIKRRESFRPFAPSILREKVSEWFEQEADVHFMMQVFKIRLEKRGLIPAVTHIDGSGRLQTVHQETNPLYHRLITQFDRLTGVPMLLNTSFNENEPVVCRPEEALDCFLRTEMDVLVMGDFFITREAAAVPEAESVRGRSTLL